MEDFEVDSYSLYINFSMLLWYFNNLFLAKIGIGKSLEQGTKPNGIIVELCMATPGNYSWCIYFEFKDLLATNVLPTKVLGMDAKAVNTGMLYLTNNKAVGVPTTLFLKRCVVMKQIWIHTLIIYSLEHHLTMLNNGSKLIKWC